jgi:hypothetical protein
LKTDTDPMSSKKAGEKMMNRIRILRCLNTLSFVIIIFGLMFAATATGQTTRIRRVSDPSQ